MMRAEENGSDLGGVDGAEPRGYEGFGGTVRPRASQSEPWWPAPHRAREGAPNVVVILVDDLGFSDVSPFGGEIDTSAIQSLADDGYRFTGFRVTPLCAPTRAALLTGANPHRVGFGFVPGKDPGYPGMSMRMPRHMPTLAESFRAGGYSTFMVGKWHLTHESDLHDAADKSSWPLQRGFDRYFGGMEGFTTLFHPHRIVSDNSPVTREFPDDEYLTDTLTDEAIGMIDGLRASDARKPFFLYFAHHAVHGPVQARRIDITANEGRYEMGWDELRRRRFARQRELGLFAGVELGDDDPTPLPAWADLDAESRKLAVRHMETYAAAVKAVDDSVGRLVSHLKQNGEYDNTLFVFLSDNGATSEGGALGTRSYFSQFSLRPDLPEDWERDVDRPIDDIGGPRVHGHYPAGWAHASNTPFRMYKGSVFEGGVRSPLIISWRAGLRSDPEDGRVRDQFSFVTDLAPTLLELAGVARVDELAGVPAMEADGESFASSIAAPAPGRRDQHLALLTQRAYYADGWKIVAPVLPPEGRDDEWRLYDMGSDPLEARDVASDHPSVVADLAERWRRAAWRNTVFPLIDTSRAMAIHPATELEFSQPVTLRPGTPTLERHRSAALTQYRSFSVSVLLEADPGDGMLFAHGDQGGGYAAWIEQGEGWLAFNAYGRMHRARFELLPGDDEIEFVFEALPDFAWRIRVLVGGADRAELAAVPMLVGLSPFTGISIGIDAGGPVDWDLHERHGSFRRRRGMVSVRYAPGAAAPYNRDVYRAIDEISARLLD